MVRLNLIWVLSLACFAAMTGWAIGEDNTTAFYIGTYTNGESEGIYRSQLDLKSGAMSQPVLAGKVDNPTFLAISADSKYVYAVGENAQFKGQNSGAVSAFSMEQDGSLKLINQRASKGRGPCHIFLGPQNHYALVANYGGGSIASLPIDSDGSLAPAISFFQHEGSSVNERRQKGPHAHAIYLVPGQNLVVAADLGLDQVLLYRANPDNGQLVKNDPATIRIEPGSGPRHLALNQEGTRIYVLNELASTLDVFAIDPKSGETEFLEKHNTLPENFEGNNSTAEIQMHPSGKWLYCSNRGHDSIAMFAVEKGGQLRALGQESTRGVRPRNFQLSPDGRLLLVANQETNDIFSYWVNQDDGTLEPLEFKIDVPSPVCIEFVK